MRIVDRANGNILLEVPDDQGETLTDLVEDVQSFQVSELFLEVAEREGVDPSIIEKLQAQLSSSPTFFAGSEPTVEGPALPAGGHSARCARSASARHRSA